MDRMDRKSSGELRDHLGLVNIRNCIQRRRLRWIGNVERMANGSWVRQCKEFVVEGHSGRGDEYTA